ncbi:MAG: RsmB/NOP family class I SAM-dependent RNA methyltransferase [Desulfobacterales bacterium]|nr:RsmB/NOP family class I SAM-dependent RNA methyltransferase [Desulfobacterales bacterium]
MSPHRTENLDAFDKYRDIIPDFGLFLNSLKQSLPTHLRVNSIKCDPSLVMQKLLSRQIPVERVREGDNTLIAAPGLENPGKLLEYALGYIHPQALTSCLASIALGVKAESFVLDLCASPGGKSSHLAQLMDNTGLVIANELYSGRRIPLGHTLARLGVMNTVITGYPAQEFPLKHSFDYVLADVPCSGEGRVRLGSPFSYYEEKGFRPRLLNLQKRAILRGFDLLKRDGEMVYSTCTYDPAENEAVVQHLLENRNADLLPLHLGFHQEPGLRSWKGENYDPRMESTVRFYPHRVDSVGFFMARVRKG